MTSIRSGRWLVTLVAVAAVTGAAAGSRDSRPNNTHKKLLECATLDGVRQHQAAFQTIADANGGTRVSGTSPSPCCSTP